MMQWEEVQKDSNDKQLFLIDQAGRSGYMNMNTEDVEGKVRPLKRDFKSTLRTPGYKNIIEEDCTLL